MSNGSDIWVDQAGSLMTVQDLFSLVRESAQVRQFIPDMLSQLTADPIGLALLVAIAFAIGHSIGA
jgi:hypothetical protein